MHNQGIPLIVIDNGSSDGSYDILKKYVGDTIIELSRIETKSFKWDFILRSLYNMVGKYNPMWMIFIDDDEFYESPFPSLNLSEAIRQESSKGYNLIQFNNFEFWPTEKDQDSTCVDIRQKIKYYSWNDNWRFKCFRNYEGTNIDETGGHLPIFPPRVRVNLSPNKFILRHYMIRSYEQGLRKIKTRLARHDEYGKKKWGLKLYEKFGEDERYFIIDSSRLTKYNEDGQWVLERKFDGHRGYGFPSLCTSEHVETEMNKFRDVLRNRASQSVK